MNLAITAAHLMRVACILMVTVIALLVTLTVMVTPLFLHTHLSPPP